MRYSFFCKSLILKHLTIVDYWEQKSPQRFPIPNPRSLPTPCSDDDTR